MAAEAPREEEGLPASCPGPASEEAGRQEGCAGCPNQAACASGAARAPDPDKPRITARLAGVRHKVLVLSGKGGVGKSTFATNLAWCLASGRAMARAAIPASDSRNGETDPEEASEAEELPQVGLLDVDITGPSLPIMTGTLGEPIHAASSGWTPVYVQDNLAVMSVGLLLPSPSDALVWRGPRKNGMIAQFLRDVEWGPLDYLVIDTPPGTSDEHLSVVGYLRESGITGAVLLSTPQEVALQDVRKEISFCRKVGIPMIGVVENMSAFLCPSCSTATPIFPPTTGGVARLCEEEGIPFLGSIPLDPRIGMAADFGTSFLEEWGDTPAAQAYLSVMRGVLDFVHRQA